MALPAYNIKEIIRREQETIKHYTNQVISELNTKMSPEHMEKFSIRFSICSNPNVVPHIFITDNNTGKLYTGINVDSILKNIKIDLRKERIDDITE